MGKICHSDPVYINVHQCHIYGPQLPSLRTGGGGDWSFYLQIAVSHISLFVSFDICNDNRPMQRYQHSTIIHSINMRHLRGFTILFSFIYFKSCVPLKKICVEIRRLIGADALHTEVIILCFISHRY